jgi:DNA replication and repair protein RecF
MPLTLLEVENLRLFEKFRLVPDLRLNLVIGRNASGKTSLLEAIYLLGTGRSFRSTQLNPLIRQTTPSFLVSGLFQDEGVPATRLALQRDPQLTRFSVGGKTQSSASSLARTLPLQIISPDSHFLFFTNTRHRRGVLDWGVFHVEPDFYPQWTRYQRALNQRNAALKARLAPKACFAWDVELAEAGEHLQGYRHRFLEEWNTRFQYYCRNLLGTAATEIELKQGWDTATDFTQALHKERGRDAQSGTTHVGPHRADISLSFLGQPARISASHGQQKLLVIALRLAQMEIFSRITTRHCVVLVDDLAAELDPVHRQQLMHTLSSMSLQVFATATETGLMEIQSWPSHKVFHVEQGRLSEITHPHSVEEHR